MTNYEFVVFTDPQFGKTDKEGDGDGTDWSMDIENVSKMCSQLDPNLAFVMCAGDLGELSDWCFVDKLSTITLLANQIKESGSQSEV